MVPILFSALAASNNSLVSAVPAVYVSSARAQLFSGILGILFQRSLTSAAAAALLADVFTAWCPVLRTRQ